MDSPIDIFARGVREGVYPGGQLAASRECQRIVTASAGAVGPGLAPTHNDVLYDLASLTKPLSATMLAGRALEQGLMRLGDPLSRFVPGTDPRITIEQLLEHAAGFPAHRRFDLELPPAVIPGSWEAWREIVKLASATPLVADPGAVAEYSDIGFILLGAALEVMHQRPLSVAQLLSFGASMFFRDRRGPPALPIIAPPQPIALTEGGKLGLVHDENAEAMGGAAGHAGLFGTAEAVLKMCEQLVLAYHGVEGGPLKPETVRRLWQPSRVKGSTRTLGWDRPSPEGSSTGGRWPRSSIGHLGFTGTSVWIEPDRALVVVLVTNRVCPSRANNLIRRLRPMFYDAAWQHWGKARPRPAKPARPRKAAEIHRPPPAK